MPAYPTQLIGRHFSCFFQTTLQLLLTCRFKFRSTTGAAAHKIIFKIIRISAIKSINL